MSRKIQIAIAILLSAFFLGVGFLTGRQFPAHHFKRFGNTFLVLDTTTGQICFPDSHAKQGPFAEDEVPKPKSVNTTPFPDCGK